MDPFLFVSIVWGLPIWAGALVGSRKGRAGWAWGLFLSWPGVLVLALLPNEPPDGVALTESQTASVEADVHVQELGTREAELQQG